MKASDYPFESFNARALSPKQVAEGFVPPQSYQLLCKRRHSVIAGPRGSGKTTLLKMLQTSALRAWSHPASEGLRAQIDFTGVFIPADRTWNEQLSAIGSSDLDATQRSLLGVSAFTTHILRAVVSALSERVTLDPSASHPAYRYIELRASDERRFSSSLAKAWGLQVDVPTLGGIRVALTQRLVTIHQIASKCSLLDESGRNLLLAECDFLHLNFLSAVPLFLDLFEETTGLRDERWALLFDELELVPDQIRNSLSQALRSVDQRLLFKLSIAPFSRELEDSVKAASDKNDFELIRLWYPSKEDGYPFSRSLVEQILHRRGIDMTPESIFGPTDEILGDDLVTSTSPRSEYRNADVYRSLAKKDPTFLAYLSRAGIDKSTIALGSEAKQAALIRKITGIVTVREANLRPREAGGKVLRRSRKANHMYCGVPAIYAICEGNPRWLIGLIDALLDHSSSDGTVPIDMQDSQISSLLARFCAFLRTIPSSPSEKRDRKMNVFSLVDSIGKSFTSEILERPFNPDPVGTFTVDSHSSDEELASLEKAIYAGAIVFVPESESEIATGSLRGKRFRLSYLLAPRYKLPMILLRPLSLGKLLSRSLDHQEGLF